MSGYPTNWEIVQIGDIADLIGGGTPSRSVRQYFQGTIPWLTGYDLPENEIVSVTNGREYITEQAIRASATNPVPINTVLLTTRVTVGKSAVTETRLCFSQDLTGIVLHDLSMIDPYYVAHFLMANRANLLRFNRGSTIVGITHSDVAKVEIPLPPLPEQQRITTILRHAAELRRRRREADELAQKLLPTLFYEMFGDPLTNTKGWEVTTIGQLTSLVTSGLTPRGGSTVYTTEGPYFIRSQNVLMNRLDLSDVACLPPQIHEEMKRTQIEDGDVLLNITGASIGRVAWVENLNHEANVSQHVCMIRLEQSKATPQYVSVYLSLPHSQKNIMLAQTGASRQGLNHQQVRRLPIHLPPYKLQIKFAKRVQLIMALGNEANSSQVGLDSLFSSLLARAFTGELTGAWREQHQSELRDAAERRDEWFKERRFPRFTPSATVAEPSVMSGNALHERVSPTQKRVYALIQNHPAIYFTLQTLWEAQDDDVPLQRDIIERGLAMLEALGFILWVHVPVSPTGEAFYQGVYRLATALHLTDELSALKDRFPNVRL